MKVEDKIYTIERSDNVLRRQTCRIDVNQYSIKQLSTSIYTFPIRAILREIAVNSYDSHVAANNPNPFEIHLPNQFEPFFSCKDWGIGLSEEDVFSLYGTYFASSKRESDSFVGAIGIGSKSIFSVSDIATIVSSHGGTKSTYSIHLNENGIPEIALLLQEDTDETGFEVLIPVEEKDFDTFKNEAAYVYKFFDRPPIITGQDVVLESIEGKYNGKNFSIGAALDGNYIVCGNIPYPVHLDSYSYPQAGIVLFAKINAISFNTAREQLQYDDKTRIFIQNALEELKSELQTFLTAELDKIDTEWALAKFQNLHISTSGSIFACLRNRYVKWKGKEIRLGEHSICLPRVEIKWVTSYTRAYSPSDSVRPGKDDIYVDNLKKGGCGRVKRAGGGKVIRLEHWRSLVKLLKRMGADPSEWTLTSTLEAPPTQRRSTCKEFRYRYNRKARECWVREEVPEECYYVYLQGYQILLDGVSRNPSDYNFRKLAAALDKPLYGLRKTAKPPKGAIELGPYLKGISEKTGATADDIQSWNYHMSDLYRWTDFAPGINELYEEYKKACENPAKDDLSQMARHYFSKEDKYSSEYWIEKLNVLRQQFDFLCFWGCDEDQYRVLTKLLGVSK